MTENVGVIGLGIMGSAYAANLKAKGFSLVGCDLSGERRDAFNRSTGQSFESVGEVARRCSRIVLSLPSGEALRQVASELATALRPGAVLIETSTLSLADKLAVRETLAGVGVLLDCPVSGTGEQARAGDLVVFGSGDKEAFERCRDLLAAMSRKQFHLGDFGAGICMKLIANHLVTIHNVAAGEALAFARKAGMDPAAVLETLGESAATSRMFQVRGPLMVRNDYDHPTATVTTHLKDLRLIRELAESAGLSLPLFESASAFYDAAAELGYAQSDTAVVCRVSEQRPDLAQKIARG